MFAIVLPFFFIVNFTSDKKLIRNLYIPKGKIIVLALAFLVLISVIVNYIILNDGKMVWSFYQVYDFRKEYGEFSSQGIFGYLNGWAMKVFSVLIFAWALYGKRLFFILMIISLIVLLFALSGHKGVLKGISLVIFLWVFESKKQRSIHHFRVRIIDR